MGVSPEDVAVGRASGALPGADPARVGPWLAEQLGDRAWSGCTMAPVGAGRSNLTYRVQSPSGAVVLRRPPVGEVAATAHDMARERRVISALGPTGVPVPAVLAFSEGGEPVDAPCYVMELVEGVVPVGTLPEGWAATGADRGRACAALVDVLVELHSLDPAAHGLGDFGRPEGFMARQVRRWGTQWEHAREAFADDHELAGELQELADGLAAAVPTTQRHTIVHGDYKLDNCIFDAADPGRIRAVLDWEMSTLGDPLADLGLLFIYWRQADDPPAWQAHRVVGPTALPGFWSRTQIADRYAAATGLDLTPLPWYVAFGAFKLAVVLAGIVARVRAGMVPESMAVGLGSVLPLVTLGRHLLAEGLT